MKIDRLIDFMVERDDTENDYAWSSRKYRKKHGHGVWFGNIKTDEEKHIEYAYHNLSSINDAVYSIFEVLGLNTDQRNRAYAAGRFMKRWYEKTGWERIPSEELVNRVWEYIQG